MSGEQLAAVEQAIEQGGDADDVLRAVVEALVEEGQCGWSGIFFAENGELVLGPQAGTADPGTRARAAVVYQGDTVAELAADGCTTPGILDEIAGLIAPYCLVGWDTGGVPWDEAG